MTHCNVEMSCYHKKTRINLSKKKYKLLFQNNALSHETVLTDNKNNVKFKETSS